MIDRRAVVERHNVGLTEIDTDSPLTVGNGEFAYTVDVTGLQSLTDDYDLHTQAQWGFHEMPNPDGWELSDVMRPYRTPRGPIDYPVAYDFSKPTEDLTEDELPGYYFWVNPQRLDLFRLGLDQVGRDRIADIDQTLTAWDGIISSRFTVDGDEFSVHTACHPDRDLIAITIDSPQLADGRTGLRLAFPGASDTFGKTADWDRPELHHTEWRQVSADDRPVSQFLRRQDDTEHQVLVAVSAGSRIEELDRHEFRISTDGRHLELVVEVSRTPGDGTDPLPTPEDVFAASTRGWEAFWRSGAAIDLGDCTDPRAPELERRIVLSQYLTRTQSAGSTPPAEAGLTRNAWAGKFHLEMHWWHAAHFAMWGRPELLERSMDWYRSILPVAREIATRQGFPGVRWPKHVGPDGREAPNIIGPLLIWQQPHPIHFAELIRLARPDDQEATLERYAEIVEETARFIAGYLYRDDDGRVHLPPAIMPAQERYEPETVWDPPFELCYFAWGLQTAQQWRRLQGLSPEPEWDELLDDLAALPIDDGHYAAVGRPARTEVGDHPSMVGALGVVPDTGRVDPAVMLRTLDFIDSEWDWARTWGWDYPMIAMTATRIGEPERAVDALARQAPRNRYLANGHNCQHPGKLPAYLPGNGGLLAAVALMAAGWVDQPSDAADHPGFPSEGWQIRAEGFPPRP